MKTVSTAYILVGYTPGDDYKFIAFLDEGGWVIGEGLEPMAYNRYPVHYWGVNINFVSIKPLPFARMTKEQYSDYRYAKEHERSDPPLPAFEPSLSQKAQVAFESEMNQGGWRPSEENKEKER